MSLIVDKLVVIFILVAIVYLNPVFNGISLFASGFGLYYGMKMIQQLIWWLADNTK
tara:strand:+ start:373 stop:540 length:168 start_codon:yes stop_codon:yes gene_type:complete